MCGPPRTIAFTREAAHVDAQRCIGCGICTLVCPARAAVLDGDRARINLWRCGACYKCVARCPMKAISIFA